MLPPNKFVKIRGPIFYRRVLWVQATFQWSNGQDFHWHILCWSAQNIFPQFLWGKNSLSVSMYHVLRFHHPTIWQWRAFSNAEMMTVIYTCNTEKTEVQRAVNCPWPYDLQVLTLRFWMWFVCQTCAYSWTIGEREGRILLLASYSEKQLQIPLCQTVNAYG